MIFPIDEEIPRIYATPSHIYEWISADAPSPYNDVQSMACMGIQTTMRRGSQRFCCQDKTTVPCSTMRNEGLKNKHMPATTIAYFLPNSLFTVYSTCQAYYFLKPMFRL